MSQPTVLLCLFGNKRAIIVETSVVCQFSVLISTIPPSYEALVQNNTCNYEYLLVQANKFDRVGVINPPDQQTPTIAASYYSKRQKIAIRAS